MQKRIGLKKKQNGRRFCDLSSSSDQCHLAGICVEQPQQWPSRRVNSLMEFIRVLQVRLCKHENKQRTEAGELILAE